MAGNVLVLHTTEGSTYRGAKAALDTNRSWSHWLHDPKTKEFGELVSPRGSARSLKNLSGGVQTNARGGIFQIEIVGRAAKVPGYSDTWYEELAKRVVWICETYNIPKKFPYRFLGEFDRPAGRSGRARLTNSQWLSLEGIVGHQHVPENDHWDPGDISRLIPLVTGGKIQGFGDDAMTEAQEKAVKEAQQVMVDAGIDIGDYGPNGDGVDGDPGPAFVRGIHELKNRTGGDPKALETLARIHDLSAP